MGHLIKIKMFSFLNIAKKKKEEENKKGLREGVILSPCLFTNPLVCHGPCCIDRGGL